MPRLTQTLVLAIAAGLFLPPLATPARGSLPKETDGELVKPGSGAASPDRPAPAPAAVSSAPARGTGSGAEGKLAEALRRAEWLSSEGRLAEAETVLIEADRFRPDFGPVLDPLARLQVRMRKRDTALITLERLIRRGAPFDDRVYILAAQTLSELGREIAGEKLLIEWAGDRPVCPNFFAAIGILRLTAYDLAGAEESIRKALETDPANDAGLKAIFKIYSRFGKYEKVQPFLDKAVAAKPRSVWARMLSGSSLMRQEKYTEAREQFRKIVEIEPGNAAGWANLGSALHSLGDPDGGIKDFRKAIQLDGKNVEAPINLATALEEAGRFAEARDTLLAARRRGIEEVDLLNALAVAYHRNGEFEAAIVVVNESLARERDQEPMRRLLKRIETDRAAQQGQGRSDGSP